MENFNIKIIIDKDIIPGDKICLRCKRSFKRNCGTQKYCLNCHAEVQCNVCKKWFSTTKENNFSGTCKACSSAQTAKNNQKPGNCTKCGEFSNKRNISGLCDNCKKEYYLKHNNEINKNRLGVGPCVKCNKILKRNAAGLCRNCQPNLGEGICTICKENVKTRSAMGYCRKCFDFTNKENQKPGNCKRCGELVNKRNHLGICINCIKEYTGNSSIYIYDNGRITHVNGTPVSDLYSVIETLLDFDIESKYPGFFIKTGLPRDYVGDFYGKEAFDQALCEKGIGYFVYIKFYNDNGVRKPLSVCKSTTRLVSDSANDVDFSYYDKKQTLSRQFLADKCLTWWTEEIYVIPISEEDYNGDLSSATSPSFTEQLICEEFGLFY